MDELDSKLRNLEELEAARAKEAWEKHVVSTAHQLSEKNFFQKAFFIKFVNLPKICLICVLKDFL